MRINVLIPSRTCPEQSRFLQRAVCSIRNQRLEAAVDVHIHVGIDHGAVFPESLKRELAVRVVESPGAAQALALNAASRGLAGDYLTILEDDDQWSPEFLATALRAAEHAEFVSSTQLEISEDSGRIVRINDFPTPSGWFMTQALWNRLGGFELDYRWHLDSEWLGRLAETAVDRIHLVEMTAPVNPLVMCECRPLLAAIAKNGGPKVRYLRHPSPLPLVLRAVHPNSGTAQIKLHPAARQESQREIDELKRRFGHLPW